jgi:hypothetical protein
MPSVQDIFLHIFELGDVSYFALATEQMSDPESQGPGHDPAWALTGFPYGDLPYACVGELAYLLGRDENGVFRGSIEAQDFAPELSGFEASETPSDSHSVYQEHGGMYGRYLLFPVTLGDLRYALRSQHDAWLVRISDAHSIEMTMGGSGWVLKGPNPHAVIDTMASRIGIPLIWQSELLRPYFEGMSPDDFDW